MWVRHISLNGDKVVLTEKLTGFRLGSGNPADSFHKIGWWTEMNSLTNGLNRKKKRAYELHKELSSLYEDILKEGAQIQAEIDDINKAVKKKRGEGIPYNIKNKKHLPKKEVILDEQNMDWVQKFFNPGLLKQIYRRVNVDYMTENRQGKTNSSASNSDGPRDLSTEGSTQTTYVLPSSDISENDLEIIADKEGSDKGMQYRPPSNKQKDNGKKNRGGGNHQNKRDNHT